VEISDVCATDLLDMKIAPAEELEFGVTYPEKNKTALQIR
jgi:hypothetical protein